MERKSGSGRPSLLNSNDISYLKKKINADPQIGSSKFAVEPKKIAKKIYLFDEYEIICVK